jgi:glutathione synthase
VRILVVMDPVERIHPSTDTTLMLITEARERRHEVHVCLPESLTLDGGEPFGDTRLVGRAGRELRPCVELGDPSRRALAEFQVVLMRKDPPFDLEFYFTTLLLERARGKTLVVNDPRGLREANEKLYIFNFPSLIAPTRVTRNQDELRRFLALQGGQMIVKPLDGCGGSGIFHVRAEDRNTNAILETITDNGRKLVMAQAYLPEAREGDKRIILLDGEPIGAVLRVPRADETRGNLHVGGTATQTTLTARDRQICAEVGARCKADGLWLVGLDVIGGWLTEVNVTSPTGVQEIDRLEGAHLESDIVDWLETTCSRG